MFLNKNMFIFSYFDLAELRSNRLILETKKTNQEIQYKCIEFLDLFFFVKLGKICTKCFYIFFHK